LNLADNNKTPLLKDYRQKISRPIAKRFSGDGRVLPISIGLFSCKFSCAECALRRREAATTCIYGHILRSLSNFSKFLDEKVGALSSPKKAQKKY
jgi:hypothetical protein